MREFAIDTAKRAGEVLHSYFESSLTRETKDDTSCVTVADREAERVIVERIVAAYPEHGILGEEGTRINPDAEYQWVIDPLDGTANFASGIPIFAVSIALTRGGESVLGVVYNPITNALYVAEKGRGAEYNGKPIHVSEETETTGLVTYGYGPAHKDRFERIFVEARKRFKSHRILGSTALELCFLARGGTEGLVCLGLHPWDYAAAALILTEAGGIVTEPDGSPWKLESRTLIGSNGAIHESLRKLLTDVG